MSFLCATTFLGVYTGRHVTQNQESLSNSAPLMTLFGLYDCALKVAETGNMLPVELREYAPSSYTIHANDTVLFCVCEITKPVDGVFKLEVVLVAKFEGKHLLSRHVKFLIYFRRFLERQLSVFHSQTNAKWLHFSRNGSGCAVKFDCTGRSLAQVRAFVQFLCARRSYGDNCIVRHYF
jgi:hypothetical protein